MHEIADRGFDGRTRRGVGLLQLLEEVLQFGQRIKGERREWTRVCRRGLRQRLLERVELLKDGGIVAGVGLRLFELLAYVIKLSADLFLLRPQIVELLR